MRRLLPVLLATVAACCAPAGPVRFEEPWQPPEWIMPVAADIARTLDTHCPLDAHVVITIAPVVGRWGESWYDEAEDVYRIVVSPLAKDADFFAEVFMHEWAHCRTACDCVDPHCEHWGVEYAACYRACIER